MTSLPALRPRATMLKGRRPMQLLSKLELISARAALRRAEYELANARGTFITAGYVQGAATINVTLTSVAYLIAAIERELTTRP